MMSNDTNLELVEDDFAEEEHRTLDAELAQFSALTPEEIARYGPYLLARIIEQLGDRATTEYTSPDDSWTLFKREPSLRNMLLESSQHGYKSVRLLKILRKAQNKSDDDSIDFKFSPVTTGTARLAWNCQYRGDNHKIMLHNINAMERSPDYANSVALIQSSGTGKSRMVDEQAKLVFTIPFNLRHPDERRGGAYPPEDTDVWRYLCQPVIKDVNHGGARVTLFFGTLFSEVATQVNHVFSGRVDKLSPGELACQWRQYLSKNYGTSRSQLYERVIAACNEVLSGGNLDQNLDEPSTTLTELLTALDKICVFPESNDVKVMLYFDEAHELYDAGKTLYDIVCSSLNRFKNSSVFTIFISTLLGPTSRQQSTKLLQAPITETAFDCHPGFPLQPAELNLKQLGELSFLARFGRPLFWTMLIYVKKAESSAILLDGMMNLARMKLVYDNGIWKPEHSDTAMLVILDVLITIDYEPRGQSVHKLEIEMVASHMRTAFSIPDHRLYIRSGYPSEPFIAEAASRQMYHYSKEGQWYFSMPGLLRKNLDAGLIDSSQKREMVMRLLLRKAYMDAIVSEQADNLEGDRDQDTNPNFSKGCSFLGFLKALFADGFHHTILNCKPDNVTSDRTLESAFEHAVVRFTHFVGAADSSIMTTRSMVMGFVRGSAIIGHNRPEGIGIAIPILLHKDRKIEEASMSAFLVQVKRQHHLGTVNAYLIDAKKLGFFPQGSTQDARSYVTLVAELGVKAPPRLTSNVATSPSGTHASERIALKSMKEHPTYGIRAYECTEKAWNVIRSNELAHYKHILSMDDLSGDHTRRAWFSDEEPRHVFQSHEAVEVGSYEDSESELGESSASTGPEVSMVVDENM